jgi:hypothetical protein
MFPSVQAYDAAYGGGGGGGGGRDAVPGFWPSGNVQLQVEVDRVHVHRKAVAGGDSIVPAAPAYNPHDDHILEGEVCAQINTDGRRPTTGVLGHPALVSNPAGMMAPAGRTVVLPHPNAQTVGEKVANRKAEIAAAMQSVVPFGVSRVSVAPNAPAGFVVQIGGLAQTRQIGEEFVQPGDDLYLDAPFTDDELRPANPDAPLTKRNWVLHKVTTSSAAVALLEMTRAGNNGDAPGRAMIKLIEAVSAVRAGRPGANAEQVLRELDVQRAIEAYHTEVMNTFQVLRRLHFGTVVRGARRGEAMLVHLNAK